MKPHRPPMTHARTLLDGTETTFKVHASERPFQGICIHFQKSKHLLGSGVSWCDHQLAQTPKKYCKTPLISTYVFPGLATEQVLIFGAVLTFGGYDKAEAKILQGRSLFNPVLSAHKTLLYMFQRLCTYFQDTGVLIFGGYVLSGHCNQQQISVKTEGVLIFGGVLIYGVLRYSLRSEFTPELRRWISKLKASHLQILHQEIFWSPW